MKPYFDDGKIQIYHGDCREIFPTEKAELLCFDPPYGTDEHGGYGRRQLGLESIRNDSDTSVRDAVLAYWGERSAIVFGSPRRAEPPGGWDFRLVWNKKMPGLGSPWRWQHEMIYLRGEWSNTPGVPSIISVSSDGRMRDRWHPHEKPKELMKTLLQGVSGVVVDPCCGSGSSIIAAKELGRLAIGIEIEERYCEIAAKRLSQQVMDFEPKPLKPEQADLLEKLKP
jgi:hypothetical protein